MFQNVPAQIQSRGRIYTTKRQRRELQLNEQPYGRGTPILVGIVVLDRSADWGVYGQSGTFTTNLGYYGEIHSPCGLRDQLGLDGGDHVRLTVQSCL